MRIANVVFGVMLIFSVATPVRAQSAATAPAATQNAAAPAPATTLTVTRDAGHETSTVTVEQLHAMPHVSVTVHNAHTGEDQTFSGVPLATLLAAVHAPLGSDMHGAAMTTGVIARGSDGYAVLLSLAEVDPAFHSGDVIVADARDGKPLDKNGPMQLVVSEDKRPARWVRNLVAIEVKDAR